MEDFLEADSIMNIHQALAALQHCFPQLHVSSALPITQGRDNFVLEINHDLIFRFPREQATEAQLMREIKLTPLLSEKLSLPVPRFEYIWHPDQHYPHPFVGYRKLKGIWLDDPGLLPREREKLFPAIAHFLSELHCIPVALATHHEVRGGEVWWWVSLYQRRFEQIQTAVFPFLPEQTQTKAKQQWEAYLAHHTSLPFFPTLIHRDLWLHHMLCDPAQGTLKGVIDWGDAAIGDPALDFIGFYRSWGREAVEKIVHLAQIGDDSTFWQRLDFYLDFYVRFYFPYTEAFKAAQSQDQDTLAEQIRQIQSTL